jgi:hypothetical protein
VDVCEDASAVLRHSVHAHDWNRRVERSHRRCAGWVNSKGLFRRVHVNVHPLKGQITRLGVETICTWARPALLLVLGAPVQVRQQLRIVQVLIHRHQVLFERRLRPAKVVIAVSATRLLRPAVRCFVGVAVPSRRLSRSSLHDAFKSAAQILCQTPLSVRILGLTHSSATKIQY